jgi:uncharacterized membrane protein YsdA (DUF1294 family)
MYIYLGLIGFMSIVTFALYGIDKNKAKKGQWRIPESTLLLSGVCLGALGGIVGMTRFRHKTKHWYFVVVNWLSLMVHIAIGICLFFPEIF